MPRESYSGRNHPLAPDPVPLEEARNAIQTCIDLIDSDGPKGGMWGQTYAAAVHHAAEKCWVLMPTVSYPRRTPEERAELLRRARRENSGLRAKVAAGLAGLRRIASR